MSGEGWNHLPSVSVLLIFWYINLFTEQYIQLINSSCALFFCLCSSLTGQNEWRRMVVWTRSSIFLDAFRRMTAYSFPFFVENLYLHLFFSLYTISFSFFLSFSLSRSFHFTLIVLWKTLEYVYLLCLSYLVTAFECHYYRVELSLSK